MYNTWMDILKSILYVAVTLVSDAFILYRLFIVWDKNYFIAAFPFLLFIADIVSSVLFVYTLTLPPGSNVYASAISASLKVFYSITLAMNVICTCTAALIALKILMIQRRISSYKTLGNNQLSRTVSIIVESYVPNHRHCGMTVFSHLSVLSHVLHFSSSLQLSSVSALVSLMAIPIILITQSLPYGTDGIWDPIITSRVVLCHPRTAVFRFLCKQTIHTHIHDFPDDVTNDIPISHKAQC
ncbi:hypothetical protein AZE42_05839 [Rhizopogon vesiculosus]|uniref:Uncharacterized protein n=1 Tax=Rhizopogon vesiculosus TaxID=180088 RepID=A0A1J8PWF7_9AGAM|nr:hypothetical protein AZE42_05839 [Rhizopogon vesiculosus]